MIKHQFTRQEALAATKTTSNKLQYLERKGLIIPHRIGQPSHGNVVLYSLEQLMAIVLDKQLKTFDNACADALVRFVANFDKPDGFDYKDKPLYCVGGYVSFDINDLVPNIKAVIPYTNNCHQHTLVVVPDLGDVLLEILGNAKSFIDFESFRNRATQ